MTQSCLGTSRPAQLSLETSDLTRCLARQTESSVNVSQPRANVSAVSSKTELTGGFASLVPSSLAILHSNCLTFLKVYLQKYQQCAHKNDVMSFKIEPALRVHPHNFQMDSEKCTTASSRNRVWAAQLEAGLCVPGGSQQDTSVPTDKARSHNVAST